MNKQFNKYHSAQIKAKEIVVKQLKTFITTKSLEVSMNQLAE